MDRAIQFYQASLKISTQIHLQLGQIRACCNLAEALSEQEKPDAAQTYWRRAYALSLDAGFDDEIRELHVLAEKFPALTVATNGEPSAAVEARTADTSLDEIDQAILDLAAQQGCVRAGLLMDNLHCSKATATRRLTTLSDKGFLEKRGKGRGTHYLLAETLPPSGDSSEAWSQRLEKVRHALAQSYGLAALTAIPREPQPLLCISARFRQTPALEQFLQLEAELSRLLQTDVNLTLAKDTP